jgi:hypothetical protein
LPEIAQTTTNAFLFCALISFWTAIAHGVRNSTKIPYAVPAWLHRVRHPQDHDRGARTAEFYLEQYPAAALGAVLLLANWPYTLLVMASTNKALAATADQGAGSGCEPPLKRHSKPTNSSTHYLPPFFGIGDQTGRFNSAFS